MGNDLGSGPGAVLKPVTTDRGDVVSAPKRKLIEVALPLETINREAAREKSIRHGHPSTLHLWWARRPLAAARAVLFAQLVDDPSSHPEDFPTEDAQRAERERLHGIIERLVVWENTRDEALLAEAHLEILKSTGGSPPPILDPFAGGGTIPLEAQRLGLDARASDLNPVAVLINKALIEIPPRFSGRKPVFPGLAGEQLGWESATGLAADVRAYAGWMRDEAAKRIGEHYPQARLADGATATVIAWVWARTVACPNPACGIEMPLVGSWWLGKKKGKEAWVRPIIVADSAHPSGRRVEFEIGHGSDGPTISGSMSGRQGAACVACDAVVSKDHIKSEGTAGRMGSRLLAVVAEGRRQRIYLAPTPDHEEAAVVDRPVDVPDQELGYDPRNLWTPPYGLTHFSDLFTSRQLLTLTTFSDLVAEARERVVHDAAADGSAYSGSGRDGPSAEAYADAVALYLSFAVSRLSSTNSSLCRWNSAVSKESVSDTFARQALPMVWDFAEGNPFCSGPCELTWSAGWVAKALEGVPARRDGQVLQADASVRPLDGALISTDPPYYDNIGYSDLADFFYIWLRRSLRGVYPDLLSTLLVPKAEELVANPYRHEGKDGARKFFEDGFRRVFARARESALADYPITVYYAFKQSEAGDDGTSSTGWETLLDGMIRSGWAITATWPMRSERGGRMIAVGTNALASSIVLALRPRLADAATTDRRGLIAALHDELPAALRKLQQGTIAPVDLPQAAIGPGMAVFSRYAKVIENDGTTMSVRSALARINEILDQVLNEQEGDFDAPTRFAIAWYRQHGYTTGKFGVADDLARARNTSVDTMVRDGILATAAGKVTLLSPAQMPEDYDVLTDDRVGTWEVLHHLIAFLERDGLPVASAFLASAQQRPDGAIDTELVKELAFLLFSIAEKHGWTQDALAFNTIATAWPDVVQAARSVDTGSGEQAAFEFEED
jgi:putative DNA methylase